MLPAAQSPLGEIGSAAQEVVCDIGVGAEEENEAVGMRLEHLQCRRIQSRSAALAGMGGGDDTAQ